MADPVWDILKVYGETDRSNVWQVQSATVIKHACLERVGAKAGIAFATPTVLRAERDEAVILVSGAMGNRSEWSIGEALVGANYRVSGKQAAYVYAMAEKRAKDRVILKLLNLHGLAYSEDEADDFKQSHGAPAASKAAIPAEHEPAAVSPDLRAAYIAECRKKILAFTTDEEVKEWWRSAERIQQFEQFDLSAEEATDLKQGALDRRTALAKAANKRAAA